MPVCQATAYLDNAAVAPLPAPARDAVVQWATEASTKGDTVWPQWAQRVEDARSVAASLIHATTEEIAFVGNTTAGISLVAEGYPWQEGDNVVVLGNEFPSNVYPWMNLQTRGVETRRVPVDGAEVDLDRLAAACDRRTRILAISWVGYATGWRIDVPQVVEMAHDQGVLVFLDAIQGLGVFPLNVRESGVDFLAADGHKWLLGPEGAGLLYVRREHLDRLRALGVGWHSVVHDHDFTHIELNLKPTAARYEGGSPNMCGVLGFGASLRMLADFGLGPTASPLADRVLAITDYACQRLAQIGAVIVSQRSARHSSGIVTFDVPGRDLQAERRRCLKAGVVLSYRGGCLRISPHAYADEDDIERLVHVLE
jgi:selenocysteine lyase/cysteine desulfurase